MAAPTETLDVKAVADEVGAALAGHDRIPTFSSRPGGLTLAQAYRVTALLRAGFEARGETITGRKIGFTNHEMWKVYGVQSPIWGHITNRTTLELAATPALRVADFVAPRIEPEIIFGLQAAPVPGLSEDALLDCTAWVAFGYEVVQSIYPGWRFTAADAVAAHCVHGALLIGARHAIATRKAAWRHELARFTVALHCDGALRQRGGGALVLDSPLLALRRLVDLLANDPHDPALRAGEIVSTGTLTLAMPVAAGENWTATVSGIALDDIALRFE
jgi:2-oxo-3-hexenedioate decarboxylase